MKANRRFQTSQNVPRKGKLDLLGRPRQTFSEGCSFVQSRQLLGSDRSDGITSKFVSKFPRKTVLLYKNEKPKCIVQFML